jgi:hypothetical protein
MGFIKTRTLPQSYVNTSPAYEIRTLSDFPNQPIDNIIYLEANTTYRIIGIVDLLGVRLVCKGIVGILGDTSETSFLYSVGLITQPLITTSYSLVIQNISIIAVIGFDINGGGTAALDWIAVNFIGVLTVGTFKNYANLVLTLCAWFDTQGLTIDGTTGTTSIAQSLLSCAAGGTLINIAPTAIIQRRFRMIFCAVIVPVGAVGVNVSAGASIPTDMHILIDMGFSGGSANYVIGITANDNRSRWNENRGIDNSANSGYYSMNDNATATVIATPNVFVKIAGTTTAGTLQRFTHANNRLTYTGILARSFGIWAAASLQAGSNQILQLQIRRYNSAGVLQERSISPRATTSNNNRAESIPCYLSVTMQPNDYIEVWVANGNNTNVTATELILMVR